MPTLDITGIVMAYVAVAVLLLCIHLYSSWNWWIKAGTTVLIACLYYVTYTAYPHFIGWPTTNDIPEKFRLIAFSVDPKKGIYIWAHDTTDGEDGGTPRAYVLPYTDTTNEAIERAGLKMKQGKVIIGELEDATTSSPPKNAEQSNQRTDKLSVSFSEAPEAKIPKKN